MLLTPMADLPAADKGAQLAHPCTSSLNTTFTNFFGPKILLFILFNKSTFKTLDIF